ncbi:hypothetical protein [Dactylosporangium sp. NPDC000521]|uniref:hypothetical protein n=1 Tax=Dactylosporangium sp. NPDC000521 TaxID=3363975 RepID=UPI003692AD8B
MAIHEAGHAVAGFLLNEPFLYVTTVQNQGTAQPRLAGHVAFDDGGYDVNGVSTPEECQRIERMIMILLAGEHAQRLLYRQFMVPALDDHSLAKHAQYDTRQIMLYATSLARYGGWPSDMTLIRSTLQTRLDELVAGERYWNLVERLAGVVMGGRTLTWNEATAVLRSS